MVQRTVHVQPRPLRCAHHLLANSFMHPAPVGVFRCLCQHKIQLLVVGSRLLSISRRPQTAATLSLTANGLGQEPTAKSQEPLFRSRLSNFLFQALARVAHTLVLVR